jgi:DNA repair exonuclease SbcCD nuclease subunit
MWSNNNTKRGIIMIFCSDLHLRDFPPANRTDDYLSEQWRKMNFLCSLAAAEEDRLLVCSGDVFDRHKPSYRLTYGFMKLIEDYDIVLITIPGQHDMEGHHLATIYEGAFGMLSFSNSIQIIHRGRIYSHRTRKGITFNFYGLAFGEFSPLVPSHKKEKDNLQYNILLIHEFISFEKEWIGQKLITPDRVLRTFSKFDIVVTGDNHKFFIHNNDGRWLINPGSMMRSDLSQMNYQPKVIRWNPAQSPEPEAIDIPIEPGESVFKRIVEESISEDKLFHEFIDEMSKNYTFELSFTANLRKYIDRNKDRIMPSVLSRLEEIYHECK